MAIQCKFCDRSFTKGEHLRRHERSHTGSRPFVCPQCRRSFARQDSLLRHQKVHSSKQTAVVSPVSLRSASSVSQNAANGGDEESNGGQPDIVTPQVPQASNLLYDGSMGFQADIPVPDMDLGLMWPDSEDLFQSILSTDLSSWQFPPGTLPLPSTISGANSMSTTLLPTSDAQSSSIRGMHSGAVHGVSQMVSSYTTSLTTAVESTSITSVFLDECLHMFFDRFIPIFPIMHRPTFVYRDCSHPLLLNAIAIGSLFLGPSDSVAKGEALWRLAHSALATSWQSMITHRGNHDACSGVQLVLAALLSVIYGCLSKNTVIRGASQALHASAFFWARQCGIFECEAYDLGGLPPLSASEEQKTQQWKLWVAREIQQRALLSHYILDGLIAHMQGNSTSVRHTSNTLKLPSSERAFQCVNVDEWLRRMHTVQQNQVSFREVTRQVFDPTGNTTIPSQGYSNLALRVLLESFQSIIADSNPEDGAIVWAPSFAQIRHALSWIYERIVDCTEISEVERLEVLLRWHAVCLESVTKTPQLCNYINKMWNVQQTLWPNRNLREHEYDLPELTGSHLGRKALLHAVAIQEIVEQLPRGRAHAVHMPSSLFAAATIFGVFSFAGHANVRIPTDVEWKDVAQATDNSASLQSAAAHFVQSNRLSSAVTTKNVLYELNSLQKLFQTLATQWGVSSDMEKIVGQWISLCHS